MDKNIVSASPHIISPTTTKNIMQDVLIALLPTTIAAVLLFGLYSLVVMLIAVLGACFGEFIFNKCSHKENTLVDYSAVVTGLLLGLNLPPVVPFYVPLIGGIFATLVVKMLFGGLGKNFANPAITARIFLVLAWGSLMTTYVQPINIFENFSDIFLYFKNVDGVTTATPLIHINNGDFENVSLWQLFIGKRGGSMGEVSIIALLIGGLYLAIKKVIDVRIPIIYISTVGLLSMVFYQDVRAILPAIMSGGLMLGAIFMATDYSTSPNTVLGVYIYSLGLGLFTVIIRRFGNLPEGVSFAILLMNIVTPLLDKYIVPKPFGYNKAVVKKQKKIAKEAQKGGNQ